MPGTKIGAAKARAKLLAANPNHFRDIGAVGGRATGKKGFAMNRELASKVGSIGGKKSRRTKNKKYEYKGRMLTAKTIAEKEGVLPSTIRARYDRIGRVTLDEA